MQWAKVRTNIRQAVKRFKKRVVRAFVPSTLQWDGAVDIVLTYADGSMQIEHLENVVTIAGKNMLINGLWGNLSNTMVQYVALGTGTTSANNTATQLQSEQFRKRIASWATKTAGNPGPLGSLSDGQLQTTVYIAPAEANTFTIGEIGWFAGANATTATNSGTMIAIINPTPISKTSLQSVQVVRTDTIS